MKLKAPVRVMMVPWQRVRRTRVLSAHRAKHSINMR